MKASWYAVKNVTNDAAEISIYDEIGLWGISAKTFIAELKGLGDRHVTVRINSPGGEIFEGNAIYNALRRHPGGVTVEIDSLAASMATVIAMAGEKRTMAENGMFMIHNPWSLSAGESKDFRRQADLLDDLKSNIVSAYAGRTGMDRDELSEMMDAETWLTATEAKDYGFITDITEPMQAAAKFDGSLLAKFDKAPASIMAKTSKPKAEDEKVEDVKPEEVKVEETAPAEVEKTEEPKVEEEPAEVKAVASLKAQAALVPDLRAQLTAAKADVTRLTNELSAKVSEHTALCSLYGKLKESLGLNEAVVVPLISANDKPPADSGEAIRDQYYALTGPEASAFYAKHQAVLSKFINKAPKTAE